MSNYLSHSFNTQTISQLFRCHSIPQGDTTHPSHHHLFRSFQSLLILHFHGPRLTTTHHDTLNTGFINFFLLYSEMHLLTLELEKLSKLTPCTPYSHSRRQLSYINISI